MKQTVKVLLILAIVAGGLAAGYKPARQYWHDRNRPRFRTAKVERGTIGFVRNATGTVEPVLKVHVGAFVSGPITKLHVEFNDEVKEGDLLAEIDPRIYNAAVAGDRAALATRKAEVERIRARLQNATNDEQRALQLRGDNEDYISDSQLDQYRFNRRALDAELLVAEASIEQAQAHLENSEANLAYTRITSPVTGVIIDRKIDPGQTLAAQFQTPELFIIAPNMREEMHVFASVDETDIGWIRQAKSAGAPVHFTVYAYPDELFAGKIWQIRLSSTTDQNVVTYPVVISVPNPDLKLLPGMTADITFQIEEKSDVTRIPSSALRYFPQKEHVREVDRDLLEGVREETDNTSTTADAPPAIERSHAQLSRHRRHVWVSDGDLLRAVEIVTGITDYRYAELLSGDLKEGDELVIGVEVKP